MSTSITKTVFFKASPDTVFEFLTQKEKLALWFHHSDQDLKQGESFELYKLNDDGNRVRAIWGQVLELNKPSKLTYTFRCGAFADADTTVTCELEAVLEGTKLTLTHTNVVGACGENALNMLTVLDQGWDEHLAQLRASV